MSRRVSRPEARAFAERWALVNDMERAELRAASLEQKFAQLAAMMESARALGWETTDPREVEEVRARWNRLAALQDG
ncbi:hypothetical protein L6R52_40235 [Myxococcota bacterium]|nr:hypothetical protein [Myxococcota bacterium]